MHKILIHERHVEMFYGEDFYLCLQMISEQKDFSQLLFFTFKHEHFFRRKINEIKIHFTYENVVRVIKFCFFVE